MLLMLNPTPTAMVDFSKDLLSIVEALYETVSLVFPRKFVPIPITIEFSYGRLTSVNCVISRNVTTKF